MNKFVDSLSTPPHLDAMPGASKSAGPPQNERSVFCGVQQRTELYIDIQRRSTAAGNAAARPELPVQPTVAGWQGCGAEGAA